MTTGSAQARPRRRSRLLDDQRDFGWLVSTGREDNDAAVVVGERRQSVPDPHVTLPTDDLGLGRLCDRAIDES